MAEGWLTKKYTTIIRFPWGLAFKERREGRKVVILLRRLYLLIMEQIPENVRVKHRVTKAIKEEKQVVKYAGGIAEKEFNLSFNVQLEQEQALKIIKEIERHFEKAGGNLKELKKEFAMAIVSGMELAKGEEKDIYLHYLAPVIDIAEKGKLSDLMEKVKTVVKESEVPRLTALAFRWEANRMRQYLSRLKRDDREVIKLLNELKKPGKNDKEKIAHLKECIAHIKEDVKREFYNSYMLFKRDFLLIMLLLRYIAKLEENGKEYARDKLMPTLPEIKTVNDLEKLKRTIAGHAQTLAQGFRRLIAEEQMEEAIARKLA